MNITADTNVLVRALVADEPAQAAEASRVMRPQQWKLVWPCWRPVVTSPMG